MRDQDAITLENLSFSYGDELILSNISFSVAPGECIGLIGPNGGGKTTLLKIILSLLKPTKGTVRLFGKKSTEALSMIGWVPQNLHFDRSFPILVHEVILATRLSHLNIWGNFPKSEIEIAKKALAEVGLSELWDRPISSLSGGQCQRVLIARALASEPKILLLDEPTANVDAKAEKEIFQLLSNLKKKITILIVTHDLNATLDLVDRILVVQKEVTLMSLPEVCEHFAMGLYHSPLLEGGHRFQSTPISFGKKEVK
jgi:zinc transport system ATP-binding protein